MHQYVIDALVAVKWFSEEPRREKALEISQSAKLGDIRVFAPELLMYEVGNALWKGKKFNVHQLQRALLSLLETNIGFSPLEKDTIYNITFYDASYVALANELYIPLISENPKDHEKIQEITFKDLSSFKKP